MLSFVFGLVVGLLLAGVGVTLPKLVSWFKSKATKVEKSIVTPPTPSVTPTVSSK